ncbi:MAG TPA: carbohydrate-binding domain-containing protein, partial [Polyangiaceae bacterium]|nr:carbohydrate-binding domain-containing protein [Polyangiaceae bacterium]
NQLFTWSSLGMLDSAISLQGTTSHPKLAALGDETRSLEDRVRSYWDSNCSMCHGVDEEIHATWDARYQTPLAEQGVIYGTLSGEVEFPEGTYVVTPGDRTRSALWERDRSTDVRVRMPPLGRSRTDTQYIALLERWIDALPRTDPPLPTCTDGVENGAETSVDCGGTCPPCCTPGSYEAETMFHQVGRPEVGGWNLTGNGYIETQHTFTGTAGTLLITARGLVAANVWPNMVVSVGSTTLATVKVTSADWATYSVPFPARSGTTHVRLAFDNDLFTPTENRNLYVDKLQITCSGD